MKKKSTPPTTIGSIATGNMFHSISLPGESWISAKGKPLNYFVSNMGRLLTTSQFGAKGRIAVMQPSLDGSGYLRTVVGGKTTKMHRLVAQTWIENPEGKPEVNHIDNNRANNQITNLEWVTHRENVMHSHRQGRAANKQGENCGTHKLKEAQVIEIRKLKEKMTYLQLAEKYSVSYAAIWDIVNRRTWFHV